MATETIVLPVVAPAPAAPPRATADFPPIPGTVWHVGTESRYEARAGVIPLEDIQRQRIAILPRLRALRARYGQQSTWDAQRKAYRSAIMIELRAGAQPSGAKGWTDVLLEAAASADDRYRAWLDNVEQEKAELTTLEVQMTHLDEAVMRGQSEMRLAQAEWMHTGSQT
jgi:hypothetical protein